MSPYSINYYTYNQFTERPYYPYEKYYYCSTEGEKIEYKIKDKSIVYIGYGSTKIIMKERYVLWGVRASQKFLPDNSYILWITTDENELSSLLVKYINDYNFIYVWLYSSKIISSLYDNIIKSNSILISLSQLIGQKCDRNIIYADTYFTRELNYYISNIVVTTTASNYLIITSDNEEGNLVYKIGEAHLKSHGYSTSSSFVNSNCNIVFDDEIPSTVIVFLPYEYSICYSNIFNVLNTKSDHFDVVIIGEDEKNIRDVFSFNSTLLSLWNVYTLVKGYAMDMNMEYALDIYYQIYAFYSNYNQKSYMMYFTNRIIIPAIQSECLNSQSIDCLMKGLYYIYNVDIGLTNTKIVVSQDNILQTRIYVYLFNLVIENWYFNFFRNKV